jgi:hypothetical protein
MRPLVMLVTEVTGEVNPPARQPKEGRAAPVRGAS